MNFTRISTLAAFFAFMCSAISLRAQDQPTLKTEYYESAVNGGKSINFKRWNTSRGGTIILTHEERDLLANGKFDQVDTIVFHNGKKLLHFITIQGKRTCFFHPESGCTVAQGDSNGDGRYDRIVVNDAKGTMVDYFDIAADGKLVPISEAQLKKTQEGMKEFSEGMKQLDK